MSKDNFYRWVTSLNMPIMIPAELLPLTNQVHINIAGVPDLLLSLPKGEGGELRVACNHIHIFVCPNV